ncbi:hypothetical protein NQ318_008726 [Aromia moschata]|uniref:Uncharacterized protein n=1 Tax=Aromia moschata TaxID=1265417 RepID=A0AAV8XB68_9CUCU|nr:hypothetical protein NQ318_008726 [Aromia moschata]
MFDNIDRRLRETGTFIKLIAMQEDNGFREMNHHDWADANPRATVTGNSQFRFKINYWVGIIGNNVLGAVERPSFLRNGLQDLLDDVPFRTELIYGSCRMALHHYALLVRQWLEENYPERWIGVLRLHNSGLPVATT